MIDKNVFILLQINDSLFPIGAYSHSYGLETYIQKQLINNMDDAFEYLSCNLRTNFLYTELLSISLAYDFAKKGKLHKLIELDNKLNALKSPREVRVASQKLGSRFIKTLMSTNIEYENDVFEMYVKESKDKIPTHTVAYGVFCYSTNIKKEESINSFLYSYTSTTITTCVKSIPLSQTSGQILLYKTYDIFKEILEKLNTLKEEDLGLSTPGFDIRSMEHEVLYSRLYMS